MGDDLMSCEMDLFGPMYIAGRDFFCKHCVLLHYGTYVFFLVIQNFIMRN